MEQITKDKAEDNKRMDARYAEQAALARERLDWDKVKHYNDLALEAAKQKLKATEDGYILHSSDGKQAIPIQDNGEVQKKIYSLIVNDPQLKSDTAARIKLLSPTFGEPGNSMSKRITFRILGKIRGSKENTYKGSGKTEPTQQQSFNVPPQMWQSLHGYQGPGKTAKYTT